MSDSDLPADPDLAASDTTEHFIIMLTEKCNLRCVFCHQVAWDAQRHDRVELDWDLLCGIVPALKRRGTRRVTLGGAGEVTVSPRWTQFAELLLAEGISVALLSNLARPLTERELEIISEFQQVTVSIDSVEPGTYHRLRWPGQVGTVLENLRRLRRIWERKRARPTLEWNCIIADATVGALVEYVETGMELGVDTFHFLELLKHDALAAAGAPGLDHAYALGPVELARARDDLHAALDRITRAGANYRIPAALLERIDQGNGQPGPGGSGALSRALAAGETRNCLDAWKTGFLNADGSVWCCCSSGEASNRVSEGPQLGPALDGGQIRQIREGLLSGQLLPACRNCSYEPVPLEAERAAVRALLERRRGWQRAFAAVSDLVASARATDESILVYGASLDASTLLACTDLLRARICGICDPDRREWGRYLKGYPVLAPGEMEALRPDVILLASPQEHGALPKDLRQHEARRVRVVDPHGRAGGPP